MEEFRNRIIQGDILEILRTFPDESIDCVVTSPPYWGLRDYGVPGQIGLEETFSEYLDRMLSITAELLRVLKKTGTLWWVHGDSYAGSGTGTNEYSTQASKSIHGKGRNKHIYKSRAVLQKTHEFPKKSLIMQNYRLVMRMIDDQGWILRNIIVWNKPACMPSSAKDRFTVDFEPVFFLTRNGKYWFEQQFEPAKDWGMRDRSNLRGGTTDPRLKHHGLTNCNFAERGRTKRTVWRIPTKPFPEAHFAVFPEALVETPIKAGCPQDVCRKCGWARRKIYRYNQKEHWGDGSGMAGRTIEEMQDTGKWRGDRSTGSIKLGPLSREKEELGYTDCGCYAGWMRGIVLDPFMGSGTTAIVARKLGRDFIGIELSGQYIEIADRRLAQNELFNMA